MDLDSTVFAFSCPAAAYPVSGLVPLFWMLEPNDDHELDIEIRCIVQGKQAASAVRFNAMQRESDRWFGLHTHLLSNGLVEVHARVLRRDGSEVGLEQAQSLVVNNQGPLADIVRTSLRRAGTSLYVNDPCDSALYNYDDPTVVPWFDKADAAQTIDKWKSAGEITETIGGYLRDFVTKGFFVAQGLVGKDLVRRVNLEIDDAVEKKYLNYAFGSTQRIEKLHERYSGIRELWLHSKIINLLRIVFQAEPRPCQTLISIFGSQQGAHQDTIHLTPFPAGYMCGVWVALEDIKPGSGELEVYVGSHRLPRVRMKDFPISKVRGNWKMFGQTVIPAWERMVKNGKFERFVYRPKAGDVLIYHENLMYAESIRRDQTLSRRSIASHMFADGAIAFCDCSGYIGHLEPRERLVAELINPI